MDLLQASPFGARSELRRTMTAAEKRSGTSEVWASLRSSRHPLPVGFGGYAIPTAVPHCHFVDQDLSEWLAMIDVAVDYRSQISELRVLMDERSTPRDVRAALGIDASLAGRAFAGSEAPGTSTLARLARPMRDFFVAAGLSRRDALVLLFV